jgi:hypothetical protein
MKAPTRYIGATNPMADLGPFKRFGPQPLIACFPTRHRQHNMNRAACDGEFSDEFGDWWDRSECVRIRRDCSKNSAWRLTILTVVASRRSAQDAAGSSRRLGQCIAALFFLKGPSASVSSNSSLPMNDPTVIGGSR